MTGQLAHASLKLLERLSEDGSDLQQRIGDRFLCGMAVHQFPEAGFIGLGRRLAKLQPEPALLPGGVRSARYAI